MVGTDGDPHGADVRREVYREAVDAGTPYLSGAELVTGAANAFLATRISFIDATAEIAEAAGTDGTLLAAR